MWKVCVHLWGDAPPEN